MYVLTSSHQLIHVDRGKWKKTWCTINSNLTVPFVRIRIVLFFQNGKSYENLRMSRNFEKEYLALGKYQTSTLDVWCTLHFSPSYLCVMHGVQASCVTFSADIQLQRDSNPTVYMRPQHVNVYKKEHVPGIRLDICCVEDALFQLSCMTGWACVETVVINKKLWQWDVSLPRFISDAKFGHTMFAQR